MKESGGGGGGGVGRLANFALNSPGTNTKKKWNHNPTQTWGSETGPTPLEKAARTGPAGPQSPDSARVGNRA